MFQNIYPNIASKFRQGNDSTVSQLKPQSSGAGTDSPAYPSLEEYDVAILNGNVIIPGVGTVKANIGIRNGKIAAMAERRLQATRMIDAAGKYVAPGIIDPHVHLGLFQSFEEEIRTETKAAAAGGVTTIGCYLSAKGSHFDGFTKKQRVVEEHSMVNILPHLVINNETQKKEIGEYAAQLGVTSFKMHMTGIPGVMPDVEDDFMMDVFESVGQIPKDCVICIHAENRSLVRRAQQKVREDKKALATNCDLSESHPDYAEEEAVRRVVFLAQEAGVQIYLVHISTARAIETLRSMHGLKKRPYVETTSAYLTIDNRSSGSRALVMEPPFRTREDVDALWSGISDDTIDTIGTDTVTMTKKEKNMDGEDIWSVIPGFPAVETHLPVMLDVAVSEKQIPLEKLITKMTRRPAEAFGIYPQKGSMLLGSDADIIIIDMDKMQTVDAASLLSRSDFTLYQGQTLKGWPVCTIVGGTVVYENGALTGEKPVCNILKR